MSVVVVEGCDMSYAHPAKPTRIPGGDQGRKSWIDEEALGFTPQAPFLASYNDGLNNFIAESWLSETNTTWSAAGSAQRIWSHDDSQVHLPFSDGLVQEKRLYNGIEQPPLSYSNDHTDFTEYNTKSTTPSYERALCRPQRPVLPISQVTQSYGTTYHSQTPRESQTVSPSNDHLAYQDTSNVGVTGYTPFSAFHTHSRQEQPSSWPVSFPEAQVFSNVVTSISPDLNIPKTLSPNVELEWRNNERFSSHAPDLSNSSYPPPMSKRKRESPQPASKKSRSETPQKEISEFVLVFENAPGALASVKHRRKLDAPVRKAARDVRKAGACHQCRFRKRTCSTGTPCMSCLKNGNGLHEIKCQRESPFVGKSVHQYFEYSSTRRVVSFDIRTPDSYLASPKQQVLTIDGVGRISHSIKLIGLILKLSKFPSEDQKIIKQTEDRKQRQASDSNDTSSVIILADDGLLGQQVEQWALEYTSKFVHAAGPDFYPTTMAQILATAYVKKGLPEAALVGAMVRVASIAFVLRAGVKCTDAQLPHRFRTIQARIDTVLYERLIIAEKDLFQMLQRLIFRSAGCLNRESIYPVALVLWQLIRILCISSSHLSNIAKKFQSRAYGQADYQFISLRLMLSTHMALFRSSNPLLLDMNDKSNQDLLSGDEELIKLAGKMRKVVLTFREKGFPEMKGSIVYKKEYFDMFRKVYDGL